MSDSLASKIQSLFQKGSADEVRKNITSIQFGYYLEYESTKRGWIYGLEDDYSAEYLRYRYLLEESRDRMRKRYQID